MRFTRPTAARNLINRGVPLVRVMLMMGHKNLPTLMLCNVADEKDLDLIHSLHDAALIRHVPRKHSIYLARLAVGQALRSLTLPRNSKMLLNAIHQILTADHKRIAKPPFIGRATFGPGADQKT